MAEMSKGFNFDDFDAQIAEALARNAEVMEPLLPRTPMPGEIGGVALHLSSLPDPPEAV